MKKIPFLLLPFLALLTFGMVACSDDDEVNDGYNNSVIQASDMSIPAEEGKNKIFYKVENPIEGSMPSARSDAEWIHDFSYTPTYIAFHADANPDTDKERTAKITLSYRNASEISIVITQMPLSESIKVEPKILSFTYKGGGQTVSIESSKSWTMDGLQSWIKADKTSGEGNDQVVFTIEAFESTDTPRKAELIFTCGTKGHATLEIVQNQKGVLLIDENSRLFETGKEGETIRVALKTNQEPVKAEIQSGVDWIKEVPTRAEMIDKEFAFEIAENTTEEQREATITFSNIDVAEQIVVRQTAFGKLIYPAVIKDANLKAYILKQYDKDGDGEISEQEALPVTEIKMNQQEVRSVEGLEYFPNLEIIDFSQCQLTKPDFSRLTNLRSLDLGWSRGLTAVNIEGCNMLENLGVAYCSRLKQLDLSHNPELRTLAASGCGFSETLDLSANTKLEDLNMKDIAFTTIDLSHNPELKSITLGGTVFKTLDVSLHTKLNSLAVNGLISSLNLDNNKNLTNLTFENTKIAEIDLGGCPKLSSLAFGSTPVVEIDLSRNLMLLSVNAYNAKSLETVWLMEGQVIESSFGIDHAIKYKSWTAPEDAAMNVEDPVYKEYLMSHFDTDKDGKLSNDEVLKITDIDISGLGISTIEGPEYFGFKNLRTFNCSKNKLTSLTSVMFFPALETIDCSDNELIGELNFAKNKNLRTVNADNNKLSSIGNMNDSVEEFSARNNELTSFRGALSIKKLNLEHNQLTSDHVGIHNCDRMTDLNLRDNKIDNVLLWSLTSLQNLDLSANPITELLTFGSGYGKALVSLNVSDTQLSTLDVSGNIALHSLKMTNCPNLTKVMVGTLDLGQVVIEKDSHTELVETNIVDALTDANFRNYILKEFDKDADGQISHEEADMVTELVVNGTTAPGTKSLDGIQYFRKLQKLTVETLESLGNTNLTGNVNLTSVSFRLKYGMPDIQCKNLKLLTSFYMENTGVETEKDQGPQRIEFNGCDKLAAITVKNCRKMIALDINDCVALEALNISDSFVPFWLGDEGDKNECSLSISYCTKLMDPQKFIPSYNIKTIWANAAQIKAMKSYFSDYYDWSGVWKDSQQ